jgi:hypothetical protein
MAWFSPMYAELVRPHLQGRVQQYPEGFLHRFSEEPLSREEITERWPGAAQWVPAELVGEINRDGEVIAEVMPERLTQMLVPPPPKPS